MSLDIAANQIDMANVSKRFLLYPNAAARLRGMLSGHKSAREHVALQDISFSVAPGESIGILGCNGAGKSTLLGLIAGTCSPTYGTISVRGHVAALLELGAGFHPGWTGRQNTEFQVRLLGDASIDTAERLSQIEAFADIGDYFDQPLRTYSSGMAMRVAFATAICAEPDILLIDETLAVGDTTFQHKCFRRIAEFRERGGTMILVTHRTDLIPQLCTRALVLDNGRLDFDGEPRDALLRYYEQLFRRESDGSDGAITHRISEWGERRMGNGEARISDIRLNGEPQNRIAIKSGDNVEVAALITFHKDVVAPVFGYTFKTVEGVTLYGSNTLMRGGAMPPVMGGEVREVRVICPMALPTCSVFLDVSISAIEDGSMTILDADVSAIRVDIDAHNTYYGLVDLGGNIAIT
ncbi:MAG: ABC transporter ATP-binding protein [Sphingopyxis sp.]